MLLFNFADLAYMNGQSGTRMSSAEKTVIQRLLDILHRMEDDFRTLMRGAAQPTQEKNQKSSDQNGNDAEPPATPMKEDS